MPSRWPSTALQLLGTGRTVCTTTGSADQGQKTTKNLQDGCIRRIGLQLLKHKVQYLTSVFLDIQCAQQPGALMTVSRPQKPCKKVADCANLSALGQKKTCKPASSTGDVCVWGAGGVGAGGRGNQVVTTNRPTQPGRPSISCG